MSDPAHGHLGDLVSGLVDGELDPETEASVSEHLEGCRRCRDLVEETREARALVRSLPTVDATPLVEGVLSRHRSSIRAGAAFVGLAGLVIGSLAVSAAVLRPAVAPDIDAMVSAHRGLDGASADETAVPSEMGAARQVRQVTGPYSAPRSMSFGDVVLARRSVHDGDDLTMVVYSAGPATVSVFQQPGRLDWDGLPPGRTVTNGDQIAWSPAATPWTAERRAVTVLVTEVGDVVVTAVSEDPGAVAAVVESLPGSRRNGLLDRVHDACSRFTEVFALGG